MSCRGLGLHVEAWDAQGRPLRDEVGELVVLTPMPSMPLASGATPTAAATASAYFEAPYDAWPDGVWRHGDWVTITARGTASCTAGRPTLNRHGVRMGSADIYAAVEALPEVAEALVLGVEQADGGYWLPLFVRLAEGVDARRRARRADQDRGARARLAAARARRGDRGAGLPHTATGKKLEVPLKRIAQGVPVEQALNLGRWTTRPRSTGSWSTWPRG